MGWIEAYCRYDLRLGPLEWRATTPRQLKALADRRRDEVRAADYRSALIASVLVTALTRRAITPEELMGEAVSAGPTPGSSEETMHFLTAMGATKKTG